MSLLKEFNAYLHEQVANHSIYVWGSQGEMHPTITEAWIKKKENSTRNAERAIAFWKKQSAYQTVLRAFDCSGLGMYFFKDIKKLYKSDMTANSMKGKCTTINRSQLRNGDWVFIHNGKKIVHIGYIVDDELNTIEAYGRDMGVVKRKLSQGEWNVYGRPKVYETIPKPNPEPPTHQWFVKRLLKLTDPMMRGEDIEELQSRLYNYGLKSLIVDGTTKALKQDGIFGKVTEAAVKLYQRAEKLTVDGKAGKNTITRLGGFWVE